MDTEKFDRIDEAVLMADIYSETCKYLRDKGQEADYQTNLKNYLKENVLEKKLLPILKKEKVEVTQGVLYINSVVILYDGRIAVYFGDKWKQDDKEEENIKQEEWINRKIFGSEESKTEFENILALCNKNKEKITEGRFPVLIFGSKRPNFPCIQIEKYRITQDLLEKPSELWKKSNEVFTDDLKSSLELFKNEFLSKYAIPIDDKQAKALLLNPLRIATKYQAPNIFYIYDNRNVDVAGGIAFVANIDNSLDETSIQAILKKLQRLVSDCILTPILIAESESLRKDLVTRAGEEPYALRFFHKEDDDEKMETRIPLVYNLYNLNIDGDDDFSQGANAVKERLKQFFRTAIGPSAKALKDYEVFSEEVFLTVLQMWDDLRISNVKVAEDKNKKEINDIKAFKFARDKEKSKLLIDLLFTALNFEPAMRFIASYREHFIHCFHTFCFGFWMLCLKNQNSNYLFASAVVGRDRLLLLKSWFLAGIFHDIGIPIQKAGDYLHTLVELLVQQKSLQIFPKWSDLMNNRNFHEVLFSEKFIDLGQDIFAAKDENASLELLRLNHKSVRLLLDKASHPVLGSLMLYDNLKNYESIYHDQTDLLSHVVMPVLVHHIWDKEWSERNTGGGKEWVIKDFSRHPIVYLLILCDAISQLERRFEDFIPKTISPLIKLFRLVDPMVHTEDGNLFYPECNLVYGVKKKSEAETFLEYYRKPFNVISSGINPVLKVIISYNLENPTKVGEFLFKTP
jgi:hypothetical protein